MQDQDSTNLKGNHGFFAALRARTSSLTARLHAFFFEIPPRFRTPLGELLVQKNIITEDQLQKALALQVGGGRKHGNIRCLGNILVDQGLADEQEIISAINDYYGLNVYSLSDNIENLIQKGRISLAQKLTSPRVTIGAQLFLTSTLIIMLVTFLFSYVMLERQREQLYKQTVRLGMVSLNYFNNNARIPLIENNILRLNTLIHGATSVEGHLYAMILDNHNQIVAHTDHNKIGTPFEGFPSRRNEKKSGTISYFNYQDAANESVLNLTSPITFQGKVLGQVHVGLSINFINDMVRKERKLIVLLCLVIIVLVGLVATVLGLRFTRPIGDLVTATKEIGRGNYQYAVDLRRNDELQDLALSFNRMSNQLWLKSRIQETFGKYVGTEILDMIIAHPESQWMKGHREDASILFADIRGFTAYAEAREAEEVVVGLNEFFEIATQTILQYGGYVDKFIGDSVLGVFGVPAAREDHITRAMGAAIAMQQRFHELAEGGNSLLGAVGIGLNAGSVVAGNIGSQDKMEYTVIGDSVNVAARLNNIAGAGEIIVSDTVFGAVADLVESEGLPLLKIKGKANPIQAHKVLGWREDARHAG